MLPDKEKNEFFELKKSTPSSSPQNPVLTILLSSIGGFKLKLFMWGREIWTPNFFAC